MTRRPKKYYEDLLAARGRDKSSTCYLFLQDVRPLSEWKSENDVMPKKSDEELRKRRELEIITPGWCHKKYEPYIELIRQMRAAGAGFGAIGKKIELSGEAVRKYVIRNPEKFDLKNEPV